MRQHWLARLAEAATLAYLRDEYGITSAVIVDPATPQVSDGEADTSPATSR